jgi:nucleolar protein 9
MTNLFVSLVTSLLPSFPSLLTSPHASPPLRLLLLVLTPNRALPSLDGSDGGIIRSKRSNKYRKGHGVQGKSFVGEEEDAGKGKAKAKAKAAEEVKERSVPKDLVETRRKIRGELMEKIDGAEWRSMALNMVGSAAVQVSGVTGSHHVASLLEVPLRLYSSCLSSRSKTAKPSASSRFSTN